MIRLLAVALMLAIHFFGPARAQETVTGEQAVGRVQLAQGFCTGSLIAPNLVLTAAHCLFDRETGARLLPDDMRFQVPGWSAFPVRRAVAHADYHPGADRNAVLARSDLALLELDRPVPDIVPLTLGQIAETGETVGIFTGTGSDAVETCEVLSRQAGVLVTSCQGEFGSSGAPIFRLEAGAGRIVSVVSARAVADGRAVLLGTSLRGPLRALKAQLAEGQGYHGMSRRVVQSAPDGG